MLETNFNSSTSSTLPVGRLSNSINTIRRLIGQFCSIPTKYDIVLNFIMYYIRLLSNFLVKHTKIRRISFVTIFISIASFVIHDRLKRDFRHPTFWQMIKATIRGQATIKMWYTYNRFIWNNLLTIGSTKYSKITVKFKKACTTKFRLQRVKKLESLLAREVRLKRNQHPQEANLRDKFKLSFNTDNNDTVPQLTLDRRERSTDYIAISGRSNNEGPRSLYGFEHGDFQYSLKSSWKKIKQAKALVFTNSLQHCSDEDLGHWFSQGKDIYAFVPHITQPFIKGNVLYKYIEKDNKLYTESTINGGSTYVEPYYIYTKYDYVSIIYKDMEYIHRVKYIKPHPNVLILHYQPIAKIIPGFLPAQPIREMINLMNHNIIRYHDSLTWIAKVGTILVTSKHEVKDYDIIQRMTNGSANSTANVFSRDEVNGETKFKHEEYLRKFNLTSTVKQENEYLNIIADSVSGTKVEENRICPTDVNDITLPKPIPKDENAIVLENIKQTKTVSMNSQPDAEMKTTKHTDLGANKAFLPEKSFKSRLFAIRLRYMSRSNCPQMSDEKINQILGHMDEFVDLIYKSTGPVTKLRDELYANHRKVTELKTGKHTKPQNMLTCYKTAEIK